MKRYLSLPRYPALVVLALAGFFAVALAFLAADLFQVARANLAFIGAFGWMAMMEGGLVQFLGIALKGVLSLGCFLGFKLCESELSQRYWNWVGR